MPRLPRVVLPGFPHHVVQRGVREMDVFRRDEDREAYLDALRTSGAKYGLSFWAWCLMTNHVHLVAVPETQQSLAKGVGEAHRRYSRMVNKHDGVKGHLFQERFYSYPIQADDHLLAVVSYVLRNPIEAGLAKSAEQYRWSSAACLTHARSDPLADHGLLKAMVHSWSEFLDDAQRYAGYKREIDEHLKRGHPFGTRAWVKRLEERLGRRLDGKLGRPKRR